MIKTPIAIFADFKSYLKDEDEKKGKKTRIYQKHKPSGFSLYVVRFDDKNYTIKYTGENASKVFADELEKITRNFYNEFKEKKPIVNIKVANEQLAKAVDCYVCGKKLGCDRVRDHCHYSGEFRGVCHNRCNLKMKEHKFILVIMHNLAGYDEKLFLRELGWEPGEVECIAKNAENFISFSKNIIVDIVKNKESEDVGIKRKITFIDSFKFMGTSLSKLVENLGKEDFKNLRREFPNDEQFNILTRKGVFPYDWFDSPEKLKQDHLPAKKEFFNKLTNSEISDEDYEHAKNVWRIFDMKTMKDYHDLYLLTDTILLADVFETFRDLCLEIYELDPAQYLTAPGLAWDAALKRTGVRLDLFTEKQSEMLFVIEAGIRGGISTIVHRYSTANNKYMKNYIPEELAKYIFYLDVNNLYGWTMCQPLPTGNFKWMTEKELKI